MYGEKWAVSEFNEERYNMSDSIFPLVMLSFRRYCLEAGQPITLNEYPVCSNFRTGIAGQYWSAPQVNLWMLESRTDHDKANCPNNAYDIPILSRLDRSHERTGRQKHTLSPDPDAYQGFLTLN